MDRRVASLTDEQALAVAQQVLADSSFYSYKLLAQWVSDRLATTVTTEMVCTGCGSTMTSEELRVQKAKNPKLISCCPERDMKPATGAATRDAALEEAAQVADAAYAKSGWHRYYRDAASFVATGIRALKSASPSGPTRAPIDTAAPTQMMADLPTKQEILNTIATTSAHKALTNGERTDIADAILSLIRGR